MAVGPDKLWFDTLTDRLEILANALTQLQILGFQRRAPFSAIEIHHLPFPSRSVAIIKLHVKRALDIVDGRYFVAISGESHIGLIGTNACCVVLREIGGSGVRCPPCSRILTFS